LRERASGGIARDVEVGLVVVDQGLFSDLCGLAGQAALQLLEVPAVILGPMQEKE
jgi:hypothetical protein